MKSKFAAVMLIATLMVTGAMASERGARLIDTVGFEMWEFDDASLMGGTLWGEIRLAGESVEWMVVAGITYGQISFDADDTDTPLWTGNLGIKYYFNKYESLQVTGGYGQMTDLAEDVELTNVKATFKQRFLPASENVSPYATVGVMYQREDYKATDDASDMYIEFHLGSDFAIRDDFAIVLDVGVIQSLENSDETFDNSGVMAGCYMKYYWD